VKGEGKFDSRFPILPFTIHYSPFTGFSQTAP
jgi:hypothetical protein